MKKTILFILTILIMISLTVSKTYALNEIVGPDVIYKESTKVLTASQIVALYESEFGAIEILEDNYTGYGDVPGIYTMTLGVEGTSYVKSIDISVRNEIGNVIAVTKTGEDYMIHLNKNTTLTQNNIINVLVNVQYIQVSSTTEISILTNTYTANATAPGDYLFEFHLANTAGFEQTYEIQLRVTNTEKLLPDIVIEEESWLQGWDDIFYMFGAFGAIIAIIIAIKKLTKKRGRRYA